MGDDADRIMEHPWIKVNDYVRVVDSKGNAGFEVWRVAKMVAGFALLVKSGIDEDSATYPDKYWCPDVGRLKVDVLLTAAARVKRKENQS